MSTTAPFASQLFSAKTQTHRVSAVRRLLGTGLTLAAAGSYGALLATGNLELEAIALGLPMVSLLVSAYLLHSTHLNKQILARSFWWSSLILGLLISGASDEPDSIFALGLALGSGGALLAMGRVGLADAKTRGRFVPIAFTGALTAGLVMAIADLQTLAMWGGLLSGIDGPHNLSLTGVGLLLSAAVMLVAIIGMFRLKMWGVALNIGANIVIATLALAVFELPEFLGVALAGTAVMQVLLPLPMLYSVVTGRKVGGPSRYAHALAPVVVGALMSAAIIVQGTQMFR